MKSWSQLKVKDIALKMTDAPFGSNLKSVDYTNSGVVVLQGRNIQGRKCDWSDLRFVSVEKFTNLKNHQAAPGSLVFPKVGKEAISRYGASWFAGNFSSGLKSMISFSLPAIHPFGISPNSLSTISPPDDLYGCPFSSGNSKSTNQRLKMAWLRASRFWLIWLLSSILSSREERISAMAFWVGRSGRRME